MPLTSLNHYLIVSSNLERSRKFYEKVLGMKLADRPDFGFPGYWLQLGNDICVHLASQQPNKTRDKFLLKKHPRGTHGSGSLDHIAFLAKNPYEVRKRIEKNKVPLHFRSFPDAKLFQMFLKDPDDVTIELNFLGEVIDEDAWRGKDASSSFSLAGRKANARKTIARRR
jgi:catechol 2,3-dioxygenase-like lactoylglutathione lyase family enzyme